jgi:hypothetical protein
MAAVINCSPVRVMQVGNIVLVQLANKADAAALKTAFDEAHLVQEDPAEFRRRYMAANGINEAGIQPE